jgi:hypothetical protein
MRPAARHWTVLLALLPALAADDWRSWFNRGIDAYKNARYQDAVEDFQTSVSLSPNEAMPHLYLATAWMAQYVPGSASPEKARSAEREFDTVLKLDPQNFTAMRSLALLRYQESKEIIGEAERLQKLDQAAYWYQRVLLIDPRNKEAYFSLSLIDWVKWYPSLTRSATLLEEGTNYLTKALEIDPQNDDVTTYRNLLIKESVDKAPDRSDAEAAAIRWVQRAMRAKVATEQTPQRVSVTGDVQQNKLIRKVPPVYPPLAKARRIHGTVRFSAIIGKDGHVLNLSLISGHPLLAVESTRVAVIQWEYKPTFFNGEPVEVVTEIDVHFSISEFSTPGSPRICTLLPAPSASAAAA